MQRRICHFSGRVQGVGFRYTAHRIASRHPVSGYVRNLPDGRVELVMEGDEAEMEQVVSEIEKEFPENVRERRDEFSPAMDQFRGFEIRH